MSDRSDILVLGGGAIGLSTALELAQAGAQVTILSRNKSEAALFAAAGMLAPQAEKLDSQPMLDLCLQSRALYPSWVHELEVLTGLGCDYWPCGILSPVLKLDSRGRGPNFLPSKALNQEALNQEALDHEALDHEALDHEWLDYTSIHQQQVGLSSQVQGGWFYPKDAQVDNRKLGQALWAAAQKLNIKVIEPITVEGFDIRGDRIEGIITNQGPWRAHQYLLATGAWSGQLLNIPVSPRKGQMLSILPLGATPNGVSNRVSNGGCDHSTVQLSHVIFGDGIYIVPRQSGQIILGATSESIGFQPNNTVAGIQYLLNSASALVPGIHHYTIQEQWWGYRPSTPDECPILGESPYQNLFLATGHFRNGILLAPITAKLISTLMLEHKMDSLLKHFHWSRFQGC